MRKILFMLPSFSQGGVEHSLITAIQNLPPKQFDITVFVRLNETRLASELPSDVHFVANRAGRFYRYPAAVWMQFMIKVCHALKKKQAEARYSDKLNRYIHRLKVEYPSKTVLKGQSFDTIISYTVDDCTEMALLIPAGKRYVFYHTPYTDFKRDMMETALPRYDGIIACGPGVYRELLKEFPDKTGMIELLSNYVDIRDIIEKANQPLPMPANVSVNDKVVLCTVGRIAPAKRYDLAVDAAKILSQQGIDFVWFFVGGGEMQQELEQSVVREGLQGKVYCMGNQNNPYPFIKNCHIYVQTSGFEAQPLTIIEALKLGVPIVSTDTLGGRTILEDGNKGILTTITGEGIAAGIMRYVTDADLYNRMKDQYPPEADEAERQEYVRKWIDLLSR